MKQRPFTDADLDQYFIINPEDHSEFLKDDQDEPGYYTFKKGIDEAELFTKQDLKELFNEPENDGFADQVGVIKVKDAFKMLNEDYNKMKIWQD